MATNPNTPPQKKVTAAGRIIKSPPKTPSTNAVRATAIPAPATPAPAAPTVIRNSFDDEDYRDPRGPITSTDINNGYNKTAKITPQPNILDQYPSYTYNVSVYLTSPAQYRQLIGLKKRNVNGYNLLFQSGGAPTNIGGAQGALGAAAAATKADLEAEGIGFAATSKETPGADSPDAGRNPFFPNDFYIDNVTIDNQFPGTQTNAAHMITDMKFTVMEPGGITLLDRMYEAVQDFAPLDATGAVNYTAAQYLMVIRWYGFDQNGNMVKPGVKDSAGLSDPKACCEKYIPFLIRKINWQVNNKLVSYDFECAPIGQQTGGSTARGTIPYDIELTDSNVAGLLNGPTTYGAILPNNAAAPAPANDRRMNDAAPTLDASGRALNDSRIVKPQSAPDKAAAAPTPKKTITAGLIGAMNKFQQELVAKGIYQYADEYSIAFPPGPPGAPKIGDGKITKPDAVVNKSSTAMSPAAKTDTRSIDPARTRTDRTTRNFSITAGQQILQAIELAIRNSSYIYNQAAIQKSEQTQPDPAKVEAGTQENNETDRLQPTEANIWWYLISMECIPTNYDQKRNDYAYQINYKVTPYQIQNFNSKYFPMPKFLGIHKEYRYWFTGENIAVLDYQATFNSLYNMTVSGREPGDSELNRLRKKRTSSMRELTKYVYQAASGESRTGAEGSANEILANAAEGLYSPSDLARGKIKIIGDPAWLQQGSVTGVIGQQVAGAADGFLPDGTINFDSNQVMFAIEWQRPQDYNLNTGLADPYSTGDQQRKPVNSYVYQAVKCVSEFRQGKFEQTIDGTLYYYPTENLKNTVASASAADDRKNTAGEDRDNTDRAATAAVVAARPSASTTRLATANTQPRVARPAAAPEAGAGRGFVNPPLVFPAATRIAPAPPAVLPKSSGTSSNRSGTVGNLKNKPATDTNGQSLPVPPVTGPTKLAPGASKTSYQVNGRPATKEEHDVAQRDIAKMQKDINENPMLALRAGRSDLISAKGAVNSPG